MIRRTLAGAMVLAGFALASMGCTVKTVDKPVTVTTKILPELTKPEVAKSAVKVQGESCSRVILLLIPVGIATAESAYAEALTKAPGTDALISYEARQTLTFIFPFYYQVCAEAHGFAINSKQVSTP